MQDEKVFKTNDTDEFNQSKLKRAAVNMPPNMCLHKCFENMSLKLQDPWYNLRTSIEYCDGARSRCQGCHCRSPAYNSKLGRCEMCYKMLYDLLDVLWECRQLVYHSFKDVNIECLELLKMECEIEKRIVEDVHSDSTKRVSRIELIDFYRDGAMEIVRNVINRKTEQLFPVCPCHRTNLS